MEKYKKFTSLNAVDYFNCNYYLVALTIKLSVSTLVKCTD